MKQFFKKHQKALVGSAGIIAICAICMSFQDSPFLPQKLGAQPPIYEDTTIKKKPSKAEIEAAIKEVEKAMQEMAIQLKAIDFSQLSEQISAALKQVDVNKIRLEVNESLKAVDVKKIMEEVNAGLKEIDVNKINADVQNALKEIDTKKIMEEVNAGLKEVDMEKINKELQEAFKEMKLELKNINTEELKKEMEKTKAELEKMKTELSKTKKTADL